MNEINPLKHSSIDSKLTHYPITVLLTGLFGLSVLLSSNYGTYSEAITVGVLIMAVYFSVLSFAKNQLYIYVGSAALAIYTALLGYQTHGMMEMNLVAIVGTILLSYYRNWKTQIPLLLLMIIQLLISGWAYSSGMWPSSFPLEVPVSMAQLSYRFIFMMIIFLLTIRNSRFIGKKFEEISSIQTEVENQLMLTERGIQFADLMSRGELESTLKVDDHDKLGHALLTMQKNLLEAKRKEDSDRYLNVGLAQTSDLLRHQYENIEQMADAVILKIIKYVGASQGAIYIAETDNETTTLVLKGCYAYNRKKFMNQRIAIGEGLVGQAAIEKEPVYLTDVPEDYINITSGLGEALPRCVLVQPLMINESVFGIIELASFEVLPDYKLNYISKVSESIASTISSVMINSKTAFLLEQSQQQSEEMRAQEEEMRQNMEELSATQEEILRAKAATEELLMDQEGQVAKLRIKEEELQRANEQMEEIRSIEKERANTQINSQKDMMVKLLDKQKKVEQELRDRIKELEAAK